MRLTASTLNDDHLLLVLATAEANPVLQSATLQARTQGVTIIALTPEQHALGDMAAPSCRCPLTRSRLAMPCYCWSICLTIR
ncbi:RpiR family transcriptional regulator [Klebsiella pneumoniae]|uniref:RpiR family transcriptional regulator n=1 Tax=Klebsiella pneumoniae TaxID=573 RepID=A0A2X3GT61_KLEPN|nr:RpiR family transcriptional regulator [Klebsiella pneumoniae]